MDISRRDIVAVGVAGAGAAASQVLVPRAALAATRPTVQLGSTGSSVRYLQRMLKSNNFWLLGTSGSYDLTTQQAVMAFQKVMGLTRDGVCGPQTWGAIPRIRAPRPRSAAGAGRVIEIDLKRQVIIESSSGRGSWVYNTSTGSGKNYTAEGRAYRAITPTGRFSVIREINGMRVSRLGELWRPKYFTRGGIAIHGSRSIPGYPASHGCVRVSYPAIDHIWAKAEAPIGRKVWVY